MKVLVQCVTILFTSLFVSSATVNNRPQQGCKFTIPTDVPENEPVYLTQTTPNAAFQIYQPLDQVTTLQPGQSLQLFCPGNQNLVQIIDNRLASPRVTGLNMTQLQCNRQSKFEVNNAVTQINRLNCTKSVMGDLLTTKRRCGPRAEANINQMGFRVNTRTFITLIEACYNNRTASANFVRYAINGRSIKYNVKESERRSFKDTGLPAGIKANDAYKKANQIAHFTQVLGARQNFFNTTSYLSRGHLAADADFVFSSAQFATYFYVNVAPQFQSINAGNWLRVEKIARNLAMNYGTDMTVYSGTLGQLKLPGNNNTHVTAQRAMYLHGNQKIIVPLYFYKIIVDERAASAIVFVTSNNPFVHRNAVRPFCEDVCQRSGLDMKQFTDTRKGYTFCCEYHTFMQQVDITPFTHNVQRLLSCSNILLSE